MPDDHETKISTDRYPNSEADQKCQTSKDTLVNSTLNAEKTATTNDHTVSAASLHMSCMIDEDGNEIPITRDMIDRSCTVIAEDIQRRQATNPSKRKGPNQR